jgi:hypothetical protein
VAPIPVCTVVQENAAAVLRNLAYEDAAYRKEIVAFKGAEALLQVYINFLENKTLPNFACS